jgi:hypothetical protein
MGNGALGRAQKRRTLTVLAEQDLSPGLCEIEILYSDSLAILTRSLCGRGFRDLTRGPYHRGHTFVMNFGTVQKLTKKVSAVFWYPNSPCRLHDESAAGPHMSAWVMAHLVENKKADAHGSRRTGLLTSHCDDMVFLDEVKVWRWVIPRSLWNRGSDQELGIRMDSKNLVM